MNGSNAKVVPEINLDEFEKRLRAAGAPAAGSEDPLAELTRLVNAVHADARRVARPSQADPPRLPSVDEESEDQLPPPPSFSARLGPPAIEHEAEADDFDEAAAPPELPANLAADAPRPRSRGWGFKVTGMIVVGVALLAGAAAFKHGVPGMPKAAPFIAADNAPTKVQPPSEANVQTSGDVAALLMKDSATPTPVKVVNSEEQPIDLRTQTQPTPTAAPASPIAAAAPAPTVDAASPVSAAPDTPIVAPAAASASVAPLFPTAKPVKTVSVRPDGTLIASAAADAPPPSATPPADAPTPPVKTAVRAVDPVVATPEAATPKLNLPTKLSPPKSQQRAVAKTDTTAPNGDASATPSAPLQLVAPAKPAPKTIDAAASADATGALASAAPPAPRAAPVEPTAAPAAGSGGWAVQLAAPRSAADARSAIARLTKKYGEALGDSELSFHQAEVRGEAIYRVRVSGLSKREAEALLAKLKAAGSDAFVAKD